MVLSALRWLFICLGKVKADDSTKCLSELPSSQSNTEQSRGVLGIKVGNRKGQDLKSKL